MHALDARFAIVREQGIAAHTHAYGLMRGWVALQGRDPEPANVWLRQGLNEAIAEGCGFHQWFGLLGLAQVAGRRGHHTAAATWYGAAERLAELGFDRSGFAGFNRRDILADDETMQAVIRTAVGDEAFAVAFAVGKALSLEQAGAELFAAPQP